MRQKHEHLHAYVLHTRPFRETSLLIDFFTKDLGRCSAVARGTSRGKSPTRILLQPFNALRISVQGSGELLTLTQVEREGIPQYLETPSLICGLYLNELLVYTLHRHDPHPCLFLAYQDALKALPLTQSVALREFELTLLEALGYGIHFERIDDTQADFYYDPQQGFQKAAISTQDCFSGKMLLEIAKKNWQEASVLSAAKRLTRLALTPLLNGKAIRSRELW